jgi:D-alanyl-D-alanine carboxypeptidase/D-alanyl-D-alanine-endopeptidase (penicillin-binding protein 4)
LKRMFAIFPIIVVLMLSFAVLSMDWAPRSDHKFGNDLDSVTNKSLYRHSTWGVLVYDPASNTSLYSKNADQMFVPGSTTKLFTSATLLSLYGPDHRFRTPVYSSGNVSAGKLNGTLILVASGDLDMGGREPANGTIDYTSLDHGDANAIGNAYLTPEDPLAGIDSLAKQVYDSGLRNVTDAAIDARFYDIMDIGKQYSTCPLAINDNLIDIMINETSDGQLANVDWRPRSSMFAVNSTVVSSEGGQTSIAISAGPGVINVSGTIAIGAGQVNQTFTVPDPVAFARNLFVESLERNGVGAAAVSPNPSDRLPPTGDYGNASKVAELVSLPLSEDVKLTLKVSQNMHADNYLSLIAVHGGSKNWYDGLTVEGRFLNDSGIDLSSISLGDGEGGVRTDVISPLAAIQLLDQMMRSANFTPYLNALPILGVDGSLADSSSNGSPAVGHVFAKTGTTVDGNYLNGQGIVLAKGLAGYVDTKGGKRVIFAVYMNNAPLATISDVFTMGNDLANVSEMIYQDF